MPQDPRHGKQAPYIVKGFCPVEPVPKGRPRFNSRTKVTYTPKKTADYESAVRAHFLDCYGVNTPPMSGPLLARYEFILPRPKSIAKRNMYKDKKPDIDNFVKSFQDALDFKIKGRDGKPCGVIENDSRIVLLSTVKRYAREGERVGTRYCIQKLDSMLVVLDDRVDKAIGDILMPSVPAILLSQAKILAVENVGGAYGSAADTKGEKGASPVRNVYLILASDTDREEAVDIIRTAFPDAKTIFAN